MLCGIPYNGNSSSHQQHHRLLRALRGHKQLEDSDSRSQDMHCRPRQPSDASSLARPSLDSSSSRPSISSRSDVSVDWDPLRLHPPLALGPSPPLGSTQGDSRPYQPHELRQGRPSHRRGRSPRRHCYQLSSDTVIYGGFDFGFDTAKPALATATTTASTSTCSSSSLSTATVAPAATSSASTRRRDASPTPSEASSVCSLTTSGSSEEEDEAAMGLAPAPAPRARPRPHPPLHHHLDQVPGQDGCGFDDKLNHHNQRHGYDEDDARNFIRRGAWKRMGIVFVNSGPPLADEEERFVF